MTLTFIMGFILGTAFGMLFAVIVGGVWHSEQKQCDAGRVSAEAKKGNGQ